VVACDNGVVFVADDDSRAALGGKFVRAFLATGWLSAFFFSEAGLIEIELTPADTAPLDIHGTS
jgi:hypothetical protein